MFLDEGLKSRTFINNPVVRIVFYGDTNRAVGGGEGLCRLLPSYLSVLIIF